jgi:Tube Death domain
MSDNLMDVEIRNLPSNFLQQIIRFFDGDDCVLSILMGRILVDMDDPNSELIFTSADVDSIRAHAKNLRIKPVAVLLSEWGTMGKHRPKLRHLLSLFLKCQLFRAVNFISQQTSQPSPPRPSEGPAALVDISLPEAAMDASLEENKDRGNMKPSVNSPVVMSLETSGVENVSIPLIPFKPPTLSLRKDLTKSNLIQFSSAKVESLQPPQSQAAPIPISTNQNPPSNTQTSLNIPTSSLFEQSQMIPATVQPEGNVESDLNLPAMTALIDKTDNLPIESNNQTNSVSASHFESSHLIPAMVNSKGNSTSLNWNVPAVTSLLQKNATDDLPMCLKALEINSNSQMNNASASHSNGNIPVISELIAQSGNAASSNFLSRQSLESSSDYDETK